MPGTAAQTQETSLTKTKTNALNRSIKTSPHTNTNTEEDSHNKSANRPSSRIVLHSNFLSSSLPKQCHSPNPGTPPIGSKSGIFRSPTSLGHPSLATSTPAKRFAFCHSRVNRSLIHRIARSPPGSGSFCALPTIFISSLYSEQGQYRTGGNSLGIHPSSPPFHARSDAWWFSLRHFPPLSSSEYCRTSTREIPLPKADRKSTAWLTLVNQKRTLASLCFQ
jgi:hypothetical protein